MDGLRTCGAYIDKMLRVFWVSIKTPNWIGYLKSGVELCGTTAKNRQAQFSVASIFRYTGREVFELLSQRL